MIEPGLVLWTALLISIAAIPVVLVVLAFLDAARTPQWVWAFTNRTQVFWIALLLGGVAVVPLGLALAGWYWLRIRPDLRAIEAGDLR